MKLVSPQDIRTASERIAPFIRQTPVLPLEEGALGVNGSLMLKLEHLQISGSFKQRGAFNNLLAQQVPAAGVTAASGGNHGAAVAYAARALGHKARIFVPERVAREEKLKLIRGFGAEIELTEGSVENCLELCARYAGESGALTVHPYDTSLTIAGQGTIALETETQTGGIDTIFVSTGGGGLISGVAAWCGERVRVVSVETEGTNTLERSLREGPEISITAEGLAAGSLGASRLGQQSFEMIRRYVDDALIVSDDETTHAAQLLWDAARLAVEPAAAVALAPLVTGAYQPRDGERIAVILCGGNAAPGWFLS